MSSIVEQIDSLEPATIRIFRDSEDDIGFREAVIYIDDEVVGWVDFKHMLEVPVRPGAHTMRAFNRVLHSKTLEFEAEAGGRLTFQVANVGGFMFKFLMMLCMGVPVMRLAQEAPEEVDSPVRKHSKRMLR